MICVSTASRSRPAAEQRLSLHDQQRRVPGPGPDPADQGGKDGVAIVGVGEQLGGLLRLEGTRIDGVAPPPRRAHDPRRIGAFDLRRDGERRVRGGAELGGRRLGLRLRGGRLAIGLRAAPFFLGDGGADRVGRHLAGAGARARDLDQAADLGILDHDLWLQGLRALQRRLLAREGLEARGRRDAVDPLGEEREAELGGDERLHRNPELRGQVLELPEIDRIDGQDTQRLPLEAEREDAVDLGGLALTHLSGAGIEILEEAAIRGREPRRHREVIDQPLLRHEAHLEQDGVERAAVDDLALERLLHPLDADQAVAHEERRESAGPAHACVLRLWSTRRLMACDALGDEGPGDPIVQAAFVAIRTRPTRTRPRACAATTKYPSERIAARTIPGGSP